MLRWPGRSMPSHRPDETTGSGKGCVMTKIEEQHMHFVDAVNNSKTTEEYWQWRERLSGFREGVEVCGVNVGHLLMHADSVQESRGVDRDMCGGVFLDWEPADIDRTAEGGRIPCSRSGT